MTTKVKGAAIAGFLLDIDINSIVCMKVITKK